MMACAQQEVTRVELCAMASNEKQSTIQDTITTGAEKAKEASPVGFLDSASSISVPFR